MILEVWDRRNPLNDNDQNPREGTIRAPIGSVPFSATPLLQYFASKRRLGDNEKPLKSVGFQRFSAF